MTAKINVENGEIPAELIDGFANEKQIPAGKSTSNHPGIENKPVAERKKSTSSKSQKNSATKPAKEKGGKKTSKQEVQAAYKASYTAANEEPSEPNWFKRNMPTWLGGASKEEIERYSADSSPLTQKTGPKATTDITYEVVTGVSVADLKEAGFSDEKIQNMVQVIESKKAAEAQKMGGMESLAAYLAKHGETLEVDAQELGITNKEVRLIQGIANKNSRNS